jgi:hypothetical protein
MWTKASTLRNMTTNDSDVKSLFSSFEHLQLSICLFPMLRKFYMLEEYFGVLKVNIIISKYSYLFVIV